MLNIEMRAEESQNQRKIKMKREGHTSKSLQILSDTGFYKKPVYEKLDPP